MAGRIVPNAGQHFNNYNPGFLADIADWADESNIVWRMTGLGGARTNAQQKLLYDAYRAGRGPLAARPGGNGPHIAVPGRGAIAIDLSPRPFEVPGMFAMTAKYALGKTVPSENWHLGRKGRRSAPSRGGIGLVFGFNRDQIRSFQNSIGASADGAWGEGTSKAVQRWAGVGQDGVIGEATVRAVQRKVGASQDGRWGTGTTSKIMAIVGDNVVEPIPVVEQPAAETKPASNSFVDGVWGSGTTRKLQTVLKQKYNAWGLNGPLVIDGKIGRNTYRALQRVLNQESNARLREDGIFGEGSKRALQRHLGVGADGKIGPATVKALQTRLEQGRV